MRIPTYIVDAFAYEPFKGNPAGVCLLESYPSDIRAFLNIAAELKHSETAFLVPVSRGRYKLRWFTPTTEVDICGHATLAAAHVLWSEEGEDAAELIFQTRSGELIARRSHDKIELDFPSMPPEKCEVKGIEELLGEMPSYLGRAGIFLMAELSSEKAIREFCPDQKMISLLPDDALLITAKSESGADHFVSRLFAPKVGIDEDPVTGSAHCVLAPYWFNKLGIEDLVGYQASERGGFVEMTFLGARVLIRGSAVITFSGQLLPTIDAPSPVLSHPGSVK